MDVILLCLQNPNDIENIICRIKDVLYILERLTPCRMSEKIQILSLLLKEIVRKLVCPSQTLEGNRMFFFFFSFTKKFINWIKLGFFFFFPSFRSRRFLRIVRYLANQDDTEPRKQLYSGLEREKIEILPFSQDMQILQRRYRRNQSTMGTYIRVVSRSKKFIFNPPLILESIVFPLLWFRASLRAHFVARRRSSSTTSGSSGSSVNRYRSVSRFHFCPFVTTVLKFARFFDAILAFSRIRTRFFNDRYNCFICNKETGK